VVVGVCRRTAGASSTVLVWRLVRLALEAGLAIHLLGATGG